MKTFKQHLSESKHPMHIHAQHVEGDKFHVVSVGHEVKHVKVGDHVRSSDLDDFAEMGHKIKEIKKKK